MWKSIGKAYEWKRPRAHHRTLFQSDKTTQVALIFLRKTMVGRVFNLATLMEEDLNVEDRAVPLGEMGGGWDGQGEVGGTWPPLESTLSFISYVYFFAAPFVLCLYLSRRNGGKEKGEPCLDGLALWAFLEEIGGRVREWENHIKKPLFAALGKQQDSIPIITRKTRMAGGKRQLGPHILWGLWG